MAKTKTKLADKDLKQLKKDLARLTQFIDYIQKMGGKIPTPLTKAVKAVELAVKAGVAIGESVGHASKELKKYTNDLKTACKTVDKELQMVCEAKIDRKWQARSVEFTLSFKNPNSVSSSTLDKIIKKLTPDAICKHWDRCAKIDK